MSGMTSSVETWRQRLDENERWIVALAGKKSAELRRDQILDAYVDLTERIERDAAVMSGLRAQFDTQASDLLAAQSTISELTVGLADREVLLAHKEVVIADLIASINALHQRAEASLPVRVRRSAGQVKRSLFAWLKR